MENFSDMKILYVKFYELVGNGKCAVKILYVKFYDIFGHGKYLLMENLECILDVWCAMNVSIDNFVTMKQNTKIFFSFQISCIQIQLISNKKETFNRKDNIINVDFNS